MRGLWLTWVLLMSPLCIACLGAQLLPIAHYSSDDGVPGDQVWGVHQDQRGYLWVGLTGGLARYDGVSFSIIGPADGLTSDVIRDILPSPTGALWLATSSALVRYDGTSIVEWGPDEGLLGGEVYSLAWDSQ